MYLPNYFLKYILERYYSTETAKFIDDYRHVNFIFFEALLTIHLSFLSRGQNKQVLKDHKVQINLALDINAPREKVIKVVLNEGYSRLPVYKDTIDNIIGVVYAKDMIN